MAGPLTEVTAARKDFAAEVAAPNLPQVAGHVLPKLLATQTHSFSQLNARGALGLVVAAVVNLQKNGQRLQKHKQLDGLYLSI